MCMNPSLPSTNFPTSHAAKSDAASRRTYKLHPAPSPDFHFQVVNDLHFEAVFTEPFGSSTARRPVPAGSPPTSHPPPPSAGVTTSVRVRPPAPCPPAF